MNPEIPVPTGAKAALRTWARTRRAALPRPTLSEMLGARLAELPEYVEARHILLYLAMPGEVNLDALARDSAKQWYVPRCAEKRRIAVHAYVPDKTPMRAGPWGIREPDPAQSPEVAPDLLDLVIVPALLLTPNGERLGYGGGYYDRFLPRLRADCVTVGVLPDALIVPDLPRDGWDARLHIIVTETSVHRPCLLPSFTGV